MLGCRTAHGHNLLVAALTRTHATWNIIMFSAFLCWYSYVVGIRAGTREFSLPQNFQTDSAAHPPSC